MNKKLNAKDFILIGVLTALMWIICMIISTVMSIAGPVTNVFYPAVVAIPNGIVMMLLLAKVPKKGVFTICGTIQGILFLLVGGFWLIPVALIVGGVICDFLIMLSDIEAGHVNCVIVKDLSRLGRNTIDTGYYIEQYFRIQDIFD